MTIRATNHSEYGKIKSVFIKPTEASFINQNFISKYWKSLNYLKEPDYESALIEYQSFEKLLRSTNAEIFKFEGNEKVNIDSIYCRDASIITNWGVILCNMGKVERSSEPNAASEIYIKNNFEILGRIESPGTIEGGDVAWIDETTLAIGRTYRTNENGIRQLKGILNPLGIHVIQVDLPHYKGPSDVFHLMSVLSPVDKDLAVVYSPLLPISFRDNLISRGYELVEVPEIEFESMGCNVLALGPRDCIMVEGNPITKERLEAAGAKVRTYKGQEISVKGGGGPTCLTRPISRFV